MNGGMKKKGNKKLPLFAPKISEAPIKTIKDRGKLPRVIVRSNQGTF
jgi:hypothetical protein